MSVTLVTFAVDDTSPFISYAPLGDTFSTPDLIAGWNPYFTLSGFANSQGQVGNGTSQHITSLHGASLGLQWSGTGIILKGNATQANYTITLDNQLLSDPNGSAADNVLANITGLNDTLHTVRLAASIPDTQNPPNSSMLVFEQAMLFSSPMPVTDIDKMGFENQTVDDQQIAFHGRWSVAPAPSGGPEFHSTNEVGDRAEANFNGTTLILLGQTGPSGGNYSVSLDNTTNTTLSARSSFIQADSLLYFATDLDPSTPHSVVVQNLDGSELALLVGGIKAVVPTPLPTPSTTSTSPTSSPTTMTEASNSGNSFAQGTIAAFALAGVLAFILISGALYLFCIYRPRRQRRRRDRESRNSYFATQKFTFEPGQMAPGVPKAGGPTTAVVANRGSDVGEGDVLDIGPNTDKLVDPNRPEVDLEQQHPTRGSKRWSLMSDFQRWRRAAVRGSLGGISLGIRFRSGGNSDSDNEKAGGPSNGGNGGNGTNTNMPTSATRAGFLDTGRPPSSTTSLPSSGSTARRERAQRKGKMRAVSVGRHSWSPSFMLDLPTWLGGQSRTQRQSRRLSALREQHIAGAGAQQYPTSFPATAEDEEMYAAQIHQQGHSAAAAEHPPSYAASVSLSNRDSVRDSHSDPSSFLVPSGPRSVSSNSAVLHGVDSQQQRRESDTQNNHNSALTTQDVPVSMALMPAGPINLKDSIVSDNLSAPLRPLPNISQHKRQQQEQKHIYAQTSPEPRFYPGVSRKIMDPLQMEKSLEATDVNSSVKEQHLMREVLRSLSPRTSRLLPIPPPPRRPLPTQEQSISSNTAAGQGALNPEFNNLSLPESVASPTRRLLPLIESGHESRWMDMDSIPSGSAGGRTVKALPRTPTSDDDDRGEFIGPHDAEFLNLPSTSPFKVEFETRSTRTSIRPLPPTTRSVSSDAHSSNSGDNNGRGGGLSSDESTNEQAYYTPAAESTYRHKPARNTFGAPESSHAAASSGGSRLSEFVQGTSGAHLPFRLPDVSNDHNANSASSPVKPSPVISEGVVSFIDFTNSPEGSLRVPSEKSSYKKTRGTRRRSLPVPPIDEPKSRWSNTTVPSIATNPYGEGDAIAHGHDSSGDSQLPLDAEKRLAASDMPSRVRLSPSPRPLPTVDTALSQRSSSITQSDNLHVHPMLESIESPTESLPLSTSEIRFRHGSDSEPDDLGSPRRRYGSTVTDEYQPRPFDPSILVSRVLGMSSPTTSSQTARPTHSRSQSNLALNSATNSVFPHDSSNDQLDNYKPGQS